MNKIEKLLQKLSPKTRTRVEQAMLQLVEGKLQSLDIKKIKGSEDIFRVRIGSYRIISRQTGDGIRFISVTKRDDRTYKSFK